MTRRKILSLLAGLPLVGRFVPKAPTDAELLHAAAMTETRIRIGIEISERDYLAASAQFGPFPIFMNTEGIWELRPIGPVKIGPFAPGSKRTRPA